MKAALLLLAVCGLTVAVRAVSVSTEPRNSDYTSPVDPMEAETRDIPDTSPITLNGDRHLLQDTTPITPDGNRHLLQEGVKEDLIAADASSSSGPSGEHGKVITVKGGQAHIITGDNGKLQDKIINTGRRLLWGWWGHDDHTRDQHDGDWHRDHDGYGRRLLWDNWGHEHSEHHDMGHGGYHGGSESAASSSAVSGNSAAAAAAAGNHGRHLSGWFHRQHKDKKHHDHDKDHHGHDGDHHNHHGRHLLDWGGWHGGWWGDRHHDHEWDHRDGDWGRDRNRHGDRDGHGGDSSASSAAAAGSGSAAADAAAGGYGK